jgi:signal transduction histidine kinase
VLDVVRVESGSVTLSMEPVQVGEVVDESVEVIRAAAQARGIRLHTPAGADQAFALADRQRLKQVLVNLLSNAVKYTPRGGNVALTLDSADDSAVLSVADTGIGIPEEDQDALFTRFFRASNAVEAAIPGSGLGLSIVRTIVANHHGELSIRSGRDQGTTVTVRIPLDNGAAPALAG